MTLPTTTAPNVMTNTNGDIEHTVLDPFAGTGNTLVTIISLGVLMNRNNKQQPKVSTSRDFQNRRGFSVSYVGNEIAYFYSEEKKLEHKGRLPIFLKPWHECVGVYRKLRISETGITVVLSLTDGQILEISFPRASREEETVLEELHNKMVGQKIAIMKTDDREKPILTRMIIPEAKVHQYRARGENR